MSQKDRDEVIKKYLDKIYRKESLQEILSWKEIQKALKENDSNNSKINEKLMKIGSDEIKHMKMLNSTYINFKFPEVDNILYRVNRDLSQTQNKLFEENFSTYAKLYDNETRLVDQYKDLLELIDFDWLQEHYLKEPKDVLETIETIRGETNEHKEILESFLNNKEFIKEKVDYMFPDINELIKDIKKTKDEIKEEKGFGNKTILISLNGKGEAQELREKLRNIADISLTKNYINPEFQVVSITIDIDPWIAEKGWN